MEEDASTGHLGQLPSRLRRVNFDSFNAILEARGFALGVVGGQVCYVTVAAHRLSDDIKPGTLAAMIRQSGLPKEAFKKP